MRRSFLFTIPVAVLILQAAVSGAAEITFRGATTQFGWTTAVFRLEGGISPGDVERTKETIERAEVDPRSVEKLVVELHSPGGIYSAGLALAAEFRRRGIETVVRSGDACYSACALAFLGGAERPRDPTAELSEIPNQPPARVLEPSARLGFHAPLLQFPTTTSNLYTAFNVQEAYRDAVEGISMLIQVSDQLYVESAELPRLLEPNRNSFFMVDTVDAVRTLWIDYADRSLQFRDLGSITQTMVANACINRWYHRQRRSALPGYARAIRAANDFEEGSALLGNGEEGLAFGVRAVSQGTASSWVAFTPVTMTEDGKNFVWCVFDSGLGSPRVLYRPAGTVAELFEPIAESNDVWDFAMADGVIAPDAEASIPFGLLRVLDMVPASTHLDEVPEAVRRYQMSEPDLYARAQ